MGLGIAAAAFARHTGQYFWVFDAGEAITVAVDSTGFALEGVLVAIGGVFSAPTIVIGVTGPACSFFVCVGDLARCDAAHPWFVGGVDGRDSCAIDVSGAR